MMKTKDLLNEFERKPDAAMVNSKTVAALLDCHVATVWVLCKKGALPAPRLIGNDARWNVGTLRRFLQGETA